MKKNNLLPQPINEFKEWETKFSLNLLKKGNFVYEGFGRNRFLRYLGPVKTYKEVRQGSGRGDIRTHNVDLEKNTIFIENNNSKEQELVYANEEDAKKVFLYIVGEENEKFLNTNGNLY